MARKIRYCWIIGATDHRNLGDHMICECMNAFLTDIDQNVCIREIPYREYDLRKPYLLEAITEDDLLFFEGGGHFGNLWPNGDRIRRDAFRTWPNNIKIMFPQTTWFSEDEEGEEVLRESSELYRGDKAVLCMREKVSYAFAQARFDCRLFLTPDIVLYGTDQYVRTENRSGAMLIMRNDKEKAVSTSDEEELKEIISASYEDVLLHDNMSSAPCNALTRKEVLCEELSTIAAKKLVVTDRLHGMIFCAITGTPCIVLDFNTPYKKIGSSYEWIQDLPYIRKVTSMAEVPEALAKLDVERAYTYPLQEKRELFRDFVEEIKRDLYMEDETAQESDGSLGKISVVVPVYNTQDYLAECLDSLLQQTYKDVEIICVNDGSPDDSKDILEKYAAADERVTVITQENGGLSRARNTGLTKACGKYVMFLDSDDYLERNALEELIRRASAWNLDMLFFGIRPFATDAGLEDEVSRYREYYERAEQYTYVCSGLELLDLQVQNRDYLMNAGGYMLDLAYVRRTGLQFHPGILHEDNPFTFQALSLAKRASVYPKDFMNRRVHAGSITQSGVHFRHLMGYTESLMDMTEMVMTHQGMDGFTDAQKSVMHGVEANMAKIWDGLSEEERAQIHTLPRDKRTLLMSIIVSCQRDAVREQYIAEIREERTGLQEKLQQTYAEKSELNAKLKQTYAEKSELNAKLQQTYAEKYDRGLQIKELNKQLKESRKKGDALEKQLNAIESSRSYKLVKRIKNPLGK